MPQALALFSLLATMVCLWLMAQVCLPTSTPTGTMMNDTRTNNVIVVCSNTVDTYAVRHALMATHPSVHVLDTFDRFGMLIADPSPAVLEWLSRHPQVAIVKRDVALYADRVSRTTQRCSNDSATPPPPPWNLDSIDKQGTDCRFDTGILDGKGTHVYVVDTGIHPHHKELEGKFGDGENMVLDEDRDIAPFGVAWGDCSGHGTHAAGIVAGTYYGVAKQTMLQSVFEHTTGQDCGEFLRLFVPLLVQ